MAKYFIDTFFNLNADIASNLSLYYKNKTITLLDLCIQTTEKNALRHIDLLMITLGKQAKYPVFYIFDEHNELFKETNNRKLSFYDTHYEFLRTFVTWTGLASGVKILFFKYLINNFI